MMGHSDIYVWFVSCVILLDIKMVFNVDGSSHDLFASLFELEMIWENELEVIEVMERVVDKWKDAPKEFQLYLKQHYTLEMQNKSKAEYLGHPINAYHFIRHVALGWDGINMNILQNNWNYWRRKIGYGTLIWNGVIDDIIQLSSRKNEILPGIQDIEGAARGIAKLWDRYRIDLDELMMNGRIITKLKNGKKVTSEPSVAQLNDFDVNTIATQALEHRLFHAAVVFAGILVNQTLQNKIRRISLDEKQFFGNIKVSHKQATELFNKAKRLNDEKLVKLGQYGKLHRTTKYPYDKNLRNHKFVKWQSRLDTILDRNTLENTLKNTDKKSMKFRDVVTYYKANAEQGDVLCSGAQLRTKSERAHLRCTRSWLNSEWMRLGPMKIDLIWNDPQIVVMKDLLYENECDVVTENLASKLKNWNAYRDPTKSGDTGETSIKTWSDVRVMKNAKIKEKGHAVLNKLNRRVEHSSGLRANSSRYESEDILCGNYGVGGDYWPHMDQNVDPGRGPKDTGDRIATLVTILQAPESGGATVFPFAGVSVFPEKGDGIYWHNLKRNEDPDMMTMHKACGVIIGDIKMSTVAEDLKNLHKDDDKNDL